jgi:hypothetical protein
MNKVCHPESVTGWLADNLLRKCTVVAEYKHKMTETSRWSAHLTWFIFVKNLLAVAGPPGVLS